MKPFSPRFSRTITTSTALRLPLGFWAVLILQARTWLLFVMAGASREQGESLLALFYPDTQRFGTACCCSAAGGAGVFAERPSPPMAAAVERLALGAGYLRAGVVRWLAVQPVAPGRRCAGVGAGVGAADALALSYLLLNARLKACFAPAEHAD